MKTIILFHAAFLGEQIHPFLINEAKSFLNKGDEVFVLCEEDSRSFKTLESIERLHLCLYKKSTKFLFFLHACIFIFHISVIKEFIISFKKRINIFKTLKEFFRNAMVGLEMFYVANKIISKNKNDKFCIDSYWYSNSAFAAALLKKKWKNKVVSFTRVHSFEIDPLKNEIFFGGAKFYSYKYLDFIGFISEYGMNFFKKNIFALFTKKEAKKCIVFRLGILKYHNYMNPQKKQSQNSVCAVSCSRIAKEKRVDLIANYLCGCRSYNIEWFHFGPGDDSSILCELNKHSHSHLTVHLMGGVPNQKIYDFYAHHHIDFLVNLSESEGIPVTIMEAFSFGIPCIATNVGGVSEIVDHKNGVLLSEPPTEKDFENAIDKIMSDSDSFRTNSFKTWDGKYNLEHNFDSIYKRITLLYEKK